MAHGKEVSDMIKIIDKVVEPNRTLIGSTFSIKIKLFKGLTYNELKTKTYTEAKSYTYSQLMKGE